MPPAFDARSRRFRSRRPDPLRQTRDAALEVQTALGAEMNGEPGWISLTAGAVLCAFSGLLLLVVIAQWAQFHDGPDIAARSVSAEMPVALRLLR